jgi:type I restriction enzyme S subunit
VSELIDAGTLAIGDGYRAKNDELGLPGLPFVRAGDLDAGQITPTKDYLSDRSARAAAAKIAKPGDTAFTSKGTIGRFAYVDADAGEAVYSPQVCFWRSLRHDIVDPIYLHYWMKSDAFKAQVDMVRGQAAIMDYVSLGDQRRMRLDVPPVRLQSHFADVVRVLLTRISCNRGLAADLASARDMLLPRLISGQLRLPDTANADSAQA